MDLLVSGRAGARLVRQPGFTTGWRALPFITIQAVISGSYRLDHGAGHDLLGPGSLWFVPPGCRHRHSVAGTRPTEMAWWQGEVRRYGVVDAFAACGAVAVLPGGLDGAVGAALARVLAAPAGDGLAAALERQARAAALVAALAATLGLDGGGDEGAAALAPVFRFVEANLHLPLSRGELAARAGLAPSRFHEVFLAATGLPPMAWVRRRRLEAAAGLLAGTGLGMAEIARRVGLCDAYHLNKRFRAAYGVPPTRFRRQAAG